MANKRMFSLQIVDTDAFLDMPQSSQLLYFHLCMRADDEGFVGNPKKIMRIIGSSDDDYKVLIAKRFILVFESSVMVIKHWLIHNTIRMDRFGGTTYQEEKAQLSVKDNKAYTLATKWQPNGNRLAPQVKLIKDKLSKPCDEDVTEDIQIIPEPQEKKKTPKKAVVEDAPFSHKEEMAKLYESKRPDFKIIALYFDRKGWIFENKEQFNGELTRCLKPAKYLKSYTKEKIKEAFRITSEDAVKNKYDWKLETVAKIIPSTLKK